MSYFHSHTDLIALTFYQEYLVICVTPVGDIINLLLYFIATDMNNLFTSRLAKLVYNGPVSIGKNHQKIGVLLFTGSFSRRDDENKLTGEKNGSN